MSMNNFWGEPDEEPLPDWMNPETYRKNSGFKGLHSKSLEQAAADALKKPPVPIIMKDPTQNE